MKSRSLEKFPCNYYPVDINLTVRTVKNRQIIRKLCPVPPKIEPSRRAVRVEMIESLRPSVQIDLNEFKLHLQLKSRAKLTLHFNSPSRSFYLSVIALVVNEMKKLGKIKSIRLQEHLDLLILLNETIGGAAGSSEKENLLHRIYRKWKDALPNLEEAPLFKVLGKKKDDLGGGIGKGYSFNDAEKDGWANLFEYMGSDENVRLRFAIDKIGVGLNETSIIFGDALNGEAWDQFIASLKKEEKKGKEVPDPAEKTPIPEPAAALLTSLPERKTSRLSRYRWVVLAVVIGIVVGAGWTIYFRPASVQVASVERMKYPLPDIPSIAVLPFANMSEDPKQEFLCDGMTEEIITALSKVPRLLVIARNSTFIYKGKHVKVQQVSEELGVQYVLEGSVRRSGDRVRITVQLIDALKGNHLWGERYERDLKDLFVLQDEITVNVLTAVQGKVYGVMAAKNAEKFYRGKKGLECYLKLLEATGHYQRRTAEDNNLARRLAGEAIAMCPENPMGYVNLGWVHFYDYLLENKNPNRQALEKGIELAQKALAMDDSISGAHGLLCILYSYKRDYERALAEGERAVALDPGVWSLLLNYANSLTIAGRPEEAIPLLQKATRLNPFGPFFLYSDYGVALRDAGRFDEAVSAFKKAIQLAPDNLTVRFRLASTYSMMGRDAEARAEAVEVLRIDPKHSLDSYVKSAPYKDPSQIHKVVNALRKAALN
jgi:adenylate cyclase